MAEHAAPLATIAIPTFNRAKLLQRSIASARAQDYPAVEILVVDNASEDDTEIICRALAAEDPRIRYIRQSLNVGRVRNFEAGLVAARGHYFMWLADDDWITPNYLRRCIEELERKGHVLVVGRDHWHFDDGVQSEPLVTALDSDPLPRMLGYLQAFSSNAAVYGLARTTHLRSLLPFPRQIVGDLQWVLRVLDRGTLGVVGDADLHRAAGGVSGDFRAMAAQLGQGAIAQRFPRIAIPLGMLAGLSRDRHIRSIETMPSRLRFAVRAGLISWIRVGSTGEVTRLYA